MTPPPKCTRVTRTRLRAAPTFAAARRDLPRPGRTAAALALRRPADALSLQRRAGNKAVVRTLQRQETGLKQAKPTAAFAKYAAAYAKNRANAKKTLEQFATDLVEQANKALAKLDCPAMQIDFGFPGPGAAGFERGDWRIGIHTDAFSQRAGIKTVADLSVGEAEAIVASIWHEARHAEQYFRIAQMRAAKSTKKKPEDVAAELKGAKYAESAATAAAAHPLAATKGNEKLLTEAQDWESITLGFQSDYKQNTTDWTEEARNALKVFGDLEKWNVDDVKARLAAFVSSWTKQAKRDLFLDARLKATEGIAEKSPLDQQVIKHLKAIKPPLEALKAAWKGVEADWDKTPTDQKLTRLRGAQAAFKALEAPLFAAYLEHPHEADARAAGLAAGTEFRKRVK